MAELKNLIVNGAARINGDLFAENLNGTVNGHSINSDVPSGAVFTDTHDTNSAGTGITVSGTRGSVISIHNDYITRINNGSTAYGWGNHASAGYLKSITSSMITNALGYTPYNSSNPSGFITGINSGMVTSALGYTPVNKAGDTITGRINRSSGGQWIDGRDNAVVFNSKPSTSEGSSWNPVCGVKTQSGSWTMGTVGGETLIFSHDNDSDYSTGTNSNVQIQMPVGKSGTVALTSDIPTNNNQLTNGAGYTKNTGTVTSVAIKMNGAQKGTAITTSGTIDLGTVITSETALSKGTTSGSGNAVTDISVSGHTITLTKGTTFLTSSDISGKADKASITAGTAGTSSATSGATVSVPYVTVNNQGIVTGYGTHNHTVSGFSTFSGNYNDLSNKPTIPTSTSQLTNNSGYITGITSGMVTDALGYTPISDLAFNVIREQDNQSSYSLNDNSENTYQVAHVSGVGSVTLEIYNGYEGYQHYFLFVNESITNDFVVALGSTNYGKYTTSSFTVPAGKAVEVASMTISVGSDGERGPVVTVSSIMDRYRN